MGYIALLSMTTIIDFSMETSERTEYGFVSLISCPEWEKHYAC
jgi:hypothetical protein